MYKSVKAEAARIRIMSKNKAKKFAKVPTVKKALKSLNVTQKAFSEDTFKYAEDLAQAIYDITQDNIQVEDTRSEGRKARDWFAKKQGFNKQEKDMMLPKSKDIEEYAATNNCSVFQAVARMSVIKL